MRLTSSVNHSMRVLLSILLTLSRVSHIQAADVVDFSRDVRPILSDNCFRCHGPDDAARQGELRFDTEKGIEAARKSVLLGDLAESELLRRITSDDVERMPPPDSHLELSPDDIDVLRRWVAGGATWGEHWAYVPPVRPVLPSVSEPQWLRNPIDGFVLGRLDVEGIPPSPPAEPARLLRRVTLDLTGIPPTPGEIDTFLDDEFSGAYDRAVERLLASPRYGERMAWEWLDAARYADTSGFQGDPERTMWPWRDWLIDSLNAGMPFDRFTIEQLAGDLLPNATLSQKVATGFCRNNMHNGEGGRIPEETRVENVFDRTETLATVWLGSTFTCCRCHDHKYDPFTRREYYQLFAFFNNTSEDGGSFRGGRIAPVLSLPTDEQAAELKTFDEQLAQHQSDITAWEQKHFVPSEVAPETANSSSADDAKTPEVPENVRDALAQNIADRSDEQLQLLSEHFNGQQLSYVERLQNLKDVRQRRKLVQEQVVAMMIMDDLEDVRETFVLERGTYSKTLEPVAAAVPARLSDFRDDRPANRLALAEWLVDSQHPLTARVTVNREWQRFFGAGLVGTAEDFGAQGDRPTHPDLLDWLATEFMRTGWDVKRLHRLIVTSSTYRQSSRVTAALQERDPKNQLLARGPRFRMPSWMLRDQALALGGLLNETQRGPSVKPYQPEGIWAEATFGKKTYEQDHGPDLYRRSLYTYWRRIVGPTMFFDAAKRQTCEVNTIRTNTPLHALTMMNDITYVEAARGMAARVLTEAGSTVESRVAHAFRMATARHPRSDEQAILVARFQTLSDAYTSDSDAALDLLRVGESPRDESLDSAEHAAMTGLCLMILNLDEALTKE